MIEKKDKKIDNQKRQMHRGRLFTNKNKRVKGGVQQADAYDTKEVNFKGNFGEIGFVGQFAVEDNPFGLPEPAPVGTSNKAVVFTDIGINSILGMRSSIIPVQDNFYRSGASAFAWAAIYSYAFPAPSDKRLKNSILGIKYGLKEVNKLEPVSFKYNSDDKKTRLGFIAQDVKEILPEIIHGSEEEMYSVSYDEVIPVLVKAVQELSAKVKELEDKVL